MLVNVLRFALYRHQHIPNYEDRRASPVTYLLREVFICQTTQVVYEDAFFRSDDQKLLVVCRMGPQVGAVDP